MSKKLIVPKTTRPRTVGNAHPANIFAPPPAVRPSNGVIINNMYGGYGYNTMLPYGKKFTKSFQFFNPIMVVMIVTSCIIMGLCMLGGTGESVKMGLGLGTIAMLVQLYILLPAWIAFGRDCKNKEFILFTCIVFLGIFALIWALVGEKKEYDTPQY